MHDLTIIRALKSFFIFVLLNPIDDNASVLARTEALSSIGLSNTKIKNDFSALIIVKSCNIEYKKSAYLEDDLQIKSFVESTSKTSFLMNQSIFKDDDLIVKAKIHLVFINEKFKPVKIPEKILSDFQPYTSSS